MTIIDAPQMPDHGSCETLTGVTLSHLPRDGSLGRARRYRKGAYLWRAKERPDRVFFLERGQAAVMTSDRDGNEIIVRVVEAGEPLGELCFCSHQTEPHETVARAIVESTAVEVRYEDFVTYLRADRPAFDAFVVTLCARLSHAERRIQVLAHRGAEARLGSLLLQLASERRHGIGGREKAVLHASHDEIAQMAAMSRSHVTVTMGQLRSRGLVEYDRTRPLVVDVDRLAAYLAGDASTETTPSGGAARRRRAT